MPTFQNVAVVGMHFRGQEAKQAAADVALGTELRLVREPENQYDMNAIRVFLEDQFIGYIEAGQAAWIAPWMDAETEFHAYVVAKELRKKNLHPILDIVDQAWDAEEIADAIQGAALLRGEA